MRSFIFACLLLFCLAFPVFACEPSLHASEYTRQDYVDNAEFIFVGTVVAGEGYNPDSVIMTAEVEVASYLKGSGAAVVQVSGFGYGPDCLSTVDIGDELIFFANRATDGSLTAAYLSAHDAVMTANPVRIAEIQLLTGQQTAPQALPFPAQFTRWIARHWLWLGGTIMILLSFGSALFIVKRKPARKPKMKREEIL